MAIQKTLKRKAEISLARCFSNSGALFLKSEPAY